MNELALHIRVALCEPRDAAKVREDVVDMRKLMLREQGSGGVWDVKRARGGLVELEFIAQTLQLIHAHAHPHVLDTNTLAALQKLHAGGAPRRCRPCGAEAGGAALPPPHPDAAALPRRAL